MENVRILWLTKEKLDTSSEWIWMFSTYGKIQKSGLLEIIPLIITWTRASIYSFCLKSVLQATLVAGVVTKALKMGNVFSSRAPAGFTFMNRCNGLCLDACSIVCFLIWLANFLVHSVLYSLQPQKKLSLERFLHSQRSWLWASTWTGQLFSSVQSLSHVWLFATPWTAAHQASLSITISRSSLRLTFIEAVKPSRHLILCHPILLLLLIPPIIRVRGLKVMWKYLIQV